MSQAAIVGQLVSCSEALMLRLISGFDDRTAVTQRSDLPNHPIWILGHCALTMTRLALMFDGSQLPEQDFVDGDGSQGNKDRFDIASIAKGSVPKDDPTLYPTLIRSQEIYAAACRRLAAVVAQLDDRELNEMTKWNDAPISKGDLVARVFFHNGAHSGQVLDLRRALNMPRVID